MNYLVDTNVLSEATRREPNVRVAAWLSAQRPAILFVSVISIGEIQKGILLLPDDRKRDKLDRWLESHLLPAFSRRILPLAGPELQARAMIQAEAEKTGRLLPAMDSLIAATARCHQLTIATQNTPDFDRCEVNTVNPWTD
ncbi:MAG: type II toxin-antitoxin system VapC family toxin [Chthoniobacterales bacterium]